MKVRAVIFDVYKTLLEVAPPPADRETRWGELWRETFGSVPRLGLAGLRAATEAVIAREHAAARARGIVRPEIYWPAVLAEALPELAAEPAGRQEDFSLAHRGLEHSVRLMPGAAGVLRALHTRGVPLGIASNAQPYTLRELDTALSPEGLGRDLFAADLQFWSFAHGFSKPDPHVFRLLGARLQARGIAPTDALMVGDRVDNDIAPAAAQGWRTWQWQATVEKDWAAFARELE